MAPRKRVTASGEIVDEEIPEGTPEQIPEESSGELQEPLPSGLPPISQPPPPEPPKDYSFSTVNNVLICNACQSSKHTDPIAKKELCSVADPSCPRNQ